jgi:hypothetical protein
MGATSLGLPQKQQQRQRQGQKRGVEVVRSPTVARSGRVQDGAPGSVVDTGFGTASPTLATMKLSRRWGTRLCEGPHMTMGPSCVGQFGLCSREISCSYCLLYIDMPESFLPDGSVAFRCSVRVLPFADTTTRPLVVTLPLFLLVSSSVCSSIIL